MEQPIKVSVICHVYNHGKYLRKCLDSLVSQKTTFAYEIIVHDDASTDGSKNIIGEYEKKYHNLTAIYQSENQYSRGIEIFKQITLPIAKGDYIAICEGDDYWIDSFKLQKQYDALENRKDIDICAHSSFLVESDSEKKIKRIKLSSKTIIIPVENVIYGEKNAPVFVATSSLFYRKRIWEKPLPFTRVLCLDLVTQINGSLKGGMLYLPDFMSCYRWHSSNSWTLRMKANEEYRLKHRMLKIQMFKQLDIDTNYKYSLQINYRILKVELQNEQNYLEAIFSQKYKPVLKRMTLLERIRLLFKRLITNGRK